MISEGTWHESRDPIMRPPFLRGDRDSGGGLKFPTVFKFFPLGGSAAQLEGQNLVRVGTEQNSPPWGERARRARGVSLLLKFYNNMC